MDDKLAKVVGIITVAPIVSILVTIWLWLSNPSYFLNSIGWFWFSLAFLTFIPISAYLLQFAIPAIRAQGRVGERKLAFIMFVASYFVGSVLCLVLQAPRLVTCILCSYFLSGFILLLINRFLKFAASGHACGMAGPLFFLAFLVRGTSWWMLFLIPLVFWARIKQGRHTFGQLVAGTLTSLVPSVAMVYVYTVLLS